MYKKVNYNELIPQKLYFLFDKHKYIELEFRMSVNKDLFEIFSNLDIFNETKTINQKIITKVHQGNQRIDLIDEQEKLYTKKPLFTVNINNDFKVVLSTETPIKSIEGNLELTILKYRTSKFIDKFNLWRFDLTKILIDDKIKYNIEAEYIDKHTPNTSDLIDIINLFRFTNPFVAIKSILNTHDIKNIRKIINNPVSLDYDHLLSIKNDYKVSPKIDGIRVLLYIDTFGHQFMINIPNAISLFDGKKLNIKGVCLLDCEYIEELKKLFILDVLIYKSKNITHLNTIKRLTKAEKIKKTIFENDNNTHLQIFEDFSLAKNVYTHKYEYQIDGLMFTQMNSPYQKMNVFKWKPIQYQTIDLLVKIISDFKDGYIIVRLYSIINKKLMNTLGLKYNDDDKKRFPEGHQSVFYPFIYSPDAKIRVTKNEDGIYYYGNIPIVDNTIIELAYNNNNCLDKIERWIPLKIRTHKTQEYLESLKNMNDLRGPNYWSTVVSVWNLINNPIIEDDLFSDNKTKNILYFNENRPKTNIFSGINIYQLHNKIKNYFIHEYISPSMNVGDLAAGRGGDLGKILNKDVHYVLFAEQVKQSILEAKKRYSQYRHNKPSLSTIIDFVQSDLTTDNITKYTKIIENNCINGLDVIIIMFAFEHFMKNKETFINVVNIIKSILKIGGKIIIIASNGQRIFDMLKSQDKFEFYYKKNIFAYLKKQYSENKFIHFGQKINYFVEKVGIEHSQYLVNFDYIKDYFIQNGFNILKHASFTSLHNLILKKYNIRITQDEKNFSSIYDYLIIQKT